MKKKIRIITDKSASDRGTFLEDLNSQSFQNTDSQLEDKTSSSSNTVSDNVVNDKYKKKKVMQKNNNKTNLGLKYVNPSQRNHSSIYE
ncbi:hypothetical protein [Candidatus Nitrosocosmicus hydrocola]|uniref:hypothetical protein n=1 Tax=Candidatus Nitrosocosmicus hydrocola TaxID=1826872 RepID=UPI0011E5B350|nr:hypothetical protein [Candidatus Nitrosocosmicus hydrocola]